MLRIYLELVIFLTTLTGWHIYAILLVAVFTESLLMNIIQIIEKISATITELELLASQVIATFLGVVLALVLIGSAMEAFSLPPEAPPTRWLPK